jgi:xylulokinase
MSIIDRILGRTPTEGPQIRAFSKRDPEAYAATREIHLVSSFFASLLSGGSAGIDHGDGAGMNLLELATGTWSPELVQATAPGLAEKLPKRNRNNPDALYDLV